MMYIIVALQAKIRYNDEEVINMNKEYLDLIYEKDEVMYKNKDSTNYKRYKRTKER